MLAPTQLEAYLKWRTSALEDYSSILSQGVNALREALEGRVGLLHSAAEKAAIQSFWKDSFTGRKRAASEDQLQKAGSVVALNIQNENVVEYTHIAVLEGNEGIILCSICPHIWSKLSDLGFDEKHRRDREPIGAEVNPRELVKLRNDSGMNAKIYFESSNPDHISLTAFYGLGRALEIVRMMQRLSDDVRPEAIFRGEAAVSLDDIIADHSRDIPGALSRRETNLKATILE